MHDTVRTWVRQAAGRNSQHSGAIVDSQTVRTSEQGGTRGYNGAKKACGCKRHLLVETLGMLLLVMITAANVQDREAARTLLTPLARRFRRLRVILADGAYAGSLQPRVGGLRKWGKVRLEIVRKPKRASPVCGSAVAVDRGAYVRLAGRHRRLSTKRRSTARKPLIPCSRATFAGSMNSGPPRQGC
jgi:hypothetical protein